MEWWNQKELGLEGVLSSSAPYHCYNMEVTTVIKKIVSNDGLHCSVILEENSPPFKFVYPICSLAFSLNIVLISHHYV